MNIQQLSQRFELPRKTLHMIFGLSVAVEIAKNKVEGTFITKMILSLILLVMGIFLLHTNLWVPLLSSFTREKDKTSFLGIGAITYFLSIICIGFAVKILELPSGVAISAVTTLAVGDPVASIIGRQFKSTRIPLFNKSYLGLFAGAGISSVCIFLICKHFQIPTDNYILYYYPLTGMIIEFILGYWKSAGKLCLDNGLIPLGIILLAIINN